MRPLSLASSVLFCLAFCVFQPQVSASYPHATVRVNRESVARGERISLGDVAEVSTSEPTASRLRAVALGYAPGIGAIRELTRERISLAIAAAGFSKEMVDLEAPPVAIVRREAQAIDPSLIVEAVEHATVSDLQSLGATARLARLDLPLRIDVPTGKVEIRAFAVGCKNLFVPFSVSIEAWVDGQLARRLNVTAQVEAYAPVLVAAHDLAEKTRLGKGDFSSEVKRLDRSPALYLSEPERLRGVSLAHSLSRGDAITTDLLVNEIVVKPGDPVRIVTESKALSIMVVGEARASGHVGDRIQVKNLQSGLTFQAVIIDEGLVSVRF
jgi:flagella basal body P-ring formation protein FlgA